MSFKPSLLKVGELLINPTQIVTVNLDFCDGGNQGVSISLSNGEFHLFVSEEARLLRCYFALGSFAIDLNSFYGESNNGGQQQW